MLLCIPTEYFYDSNNMLIKVWLRLMIDWYPGRESMRWALLNFKLRARLAATTCPRSLGQFYIVSYCIKWVNTSWTDSMIIILYVQDVFVGYTRYKNIDKRLLGYTLSSKKSSKKFITLFLFISKQKITYRIWISSFSPSNIRSQII